MVSESQRRILVSENHWRILISVKDNNQRRLLKICIDSDDHRKENDSDNPRIINENIGATMTVTIPDENMYF